MSPQVHRYELSEQEWQLLKPLRPEPKHPGHPAKDHRLLIKGMLWILHTGVPWRDLDTAGALDWELWVIDSTHIRAHRSAAGARGKSARRLSPRITHSVAAAGAGAARCTWSPTERGCR